MAGNGSGTAEELMSDSAGPGVLATLEQVDGRDLGPSLAFPVSEGPRSAHHADDQVGLGSVLVGDVSVKEPVEHVSSDVGVDWPAVAELAAGPGTAGNDTIFREEVLEHTGMHVPGPPVGPSAKLGCHVAHLPMGEDLTQPADLRGWEPGDRTASGEGQQPPCPCRRPRPPGVALLSGEPIDAARVDQPPARDLARIESSASNELADTLE